MTSAEAMLKVWNERLEPIESVESLVCEIDSRARVYGYLYTSAKRIVFPDGSVAEYANGCLNVIK